MLNKAIKELMSQRGLNAKTLCVAMGQLESTFSRMFMNEDSDPKASSIALLARRLNVKVSDIYLEKEMLEPELCRFFYSEAVNIASDSSIKREVLINGDWIVYNEKTKSTESSSHEDVYYIGEAPRYHTKLNGQVQCPDLYKKLCDEKRKKEK
jgi:transcriptional regulator with XRE-family HTH domain